MNQLQKEVLMPDEIAEILRVSANDVVAELESGRLNGFRVGSHWRVTNESLRRFMGGGNDSRPPGDPVVPDATGADWSEREPFEFRWPDGTVERYDSAFEADVTLKTGTKHVVIGLGNRKAAGQDRRRVVVFFGEPPKLVPVVEFTGANDFNTTKRVASVVKDRTGHHVRSESQLPTEYIGMPTEIYSDVVVGPYAARSVAVVVTENDLDTMLKHALIRALYKGWIGE